MFDGDQHQSRGEQRRKLPAANGKSFGLLGVRERVALFGGTFQAGNRAGGGFGLRALLPLDEVPR